MKFILMMSLSILIFILYFGSIWYVPFRLSRLLDLDRTWPLYIGVAISVMAFPILMGFFSTTSNTFVETLTVIAGVVLGFHLFFTLLLLIIDALRLWIQIPDNLAVIVTASIAVLITAFSVWRAELFNVSEIEIPLDGLEQNVTIMHISDVHIGHQRGRAHLEKIVRETNRYQPDLVLINGDLVDANSALEPGVLDPLADFDAPAYFTTGNHESYVDTKRALENIASHGVNILHNEVVGTHGLQLVGLDYMNADENAFDMHTVNKLTIKEELPKLTLANGKPIVLMHHSPVGLKYVIEQNVSLMLSGHTHAGQVFPATLFAQLLFPLNKGLHKIDSTYFLVSQGAGTFGPRLRLGTSNEINLIRLKAKSLVE